MRNLLFIILIIFFASCSSTKNKKTIDLIGKWHQFSKEIGYTEYEIDSQFVIPFSEKSGYCGGFEYKIEGDTIKYLENQFSAKIIIIADSIVVFRNNDNIDTLIKFKEPNIPFISIPHNLDSNYSTYSDDFFKRAELAWIKSGYVR